MLENSSAYTYTSPCLRTRYSQAYFAMHKASAIIAVSKHLRVSMPKDSLTCRAYRTMSMLREEKFIKPYGQCSIAGQIYIPFYGEAESSSCIFKAIDNLVCFFSGFHIYYLVVIRSYYMTMDDASKMPAIFNTPEGPPLTAERLGLTHA